MTLYAFRCPNCGTEAHYIYPMGAAPDFIECPETTCDDRARRLPSRGAFSTVPGGHNATYGSKP